MSNTGWPTARLGDFDDLGLLAEGGMGQVFRVRDRDLGRVMVLKAVRPELVGKPALEQRFMAEAQITSQLVHPGIVPVHRLGRLPDGRCYYTMAEVQGRTLVEVIRAVHSAVRGGAWLPAEGGWTFHGLVEIFLKACEAVAFAHTAGVIHRDLKPENIMVGEHGQVTVVDWGLAAVLDGPEETRVETVRTGAGQTRSGAVSGTPAYMAPEQARGERRALGPWTDVYALGAVLREILTERPPFVGHSAMDVILQARSQSPEPLPSVSPGGAPLPEALRSLCEAAMARETQDRPPSAGPLARAVRGWLDGTARRARGLRLVAEASALAETAREVRTRARSLHARAVDALRDVPPWAPVAEKLGDWALEDEAREVARRAEALERRREQLLHGALTHAPELGEAHTALAALYRRAHRRAEANGEPCEELQDRVRLHTEALPVGSPQRRLHLAYLDGAGLLTLHTDPPGAQVQLARLAQVHRRRVPTEPRILGTTPLLEVPLPMGSYLLQVSLPGHATATVPVYLDRQRHWDGRDPAGRVVPLALRPEGALASWACHVPAGWCWIGGDEDAAGAGPRQRVWVDAFQLAQHPVTNAEYIVFLDDLAAQGREAEALRWAPRERGGTVGDLGAMIYGRTPKGGFTLRPDADGDLWLQDYPVVMIDHEGATAYAAWFAARSGQPWRLPTELEWEKAGRGVDGRPYPWGSFFDATWAACRDSRPGRPMPAEVHEYPGDVSPYGVRGLAGNAMDWTSSVYREEGALIHDGRAGSPESTGERMVIRGGGWIHTPRSCRLAFRYGHPPHHRDGDLGFRLACGLGGDGRR